MTDPQSHAAIQPPTPRFQFSLRTLLLLCVVLGSSLAVFGGWGIVVFGLVVALAIDHDDAKTTWSVARLVLIAIGVICLIGGLLLVGIVREHRRSMTCWHKLTDIAMALVSYRATCGHYPPSYVADKSGKPMHSWRVLILPFMDQDQLYKAYDFTQPWDAPQNKKLLTERPLEYFCDNDPGANRASSTETSYLAVVGPNTAWTGATAMSNSIVVVEVNNSNIQWTEPKDFSLDSIEGDDCALGSPSLSSSHGRDEDFFFVYDRSCGVNMAMANGGVGFLRTAHLSTDSLRKILQVGGCTEEVWDSRNEVSTGWCPNWPNIAALLVWLLSVGTLLVGAVRRRKRMSVVPMPPACADHLGSG
jgi:hypothetical protein